VRALSVRNARTSTGRTSRSDGGIVGVTNRATCVIPAAEPGVSV